LCSFWPLRGIGVICWVYLLSSTSSFSFCISMWHAISTNAFLMMSYQNFDLFHQNVHIKVYETNTNLKKFEVFTIILN
jgi:hypothetical protein